MSKLSPLETLLSPLHCNALLPISHSPSTSAADPNAVFVGMYHLSSGGGDDASTSEAGETNSRKGGLAVWQQGSQRLQPVAAAAEDMPGVFDLHTEKLLGPDTVVVTCADGTLKLLSRSSSDDGEWKIAKSFQVTDTLLTSSALLHPSHCSPLSFLCTAHGGDVHVVDAEAGTVTQSWTAHEFDAWTASSLGAANGDDVPAETAGSGWSAVTGGDDGLAKAWDLRQGVDRPVWSRRHDAGVVHFSPVPNAPHSFLVGSYDEHVYLYDRRAPRSAVAQHKVGGGGAWRVRPVTPSGTDAESSSCLIAVAAMQGGGVVLRLDSAVSTFEEVGRTHLADGEEGVAEPLIYDAWLVSTNTSEAETKPSGSEMELWTCSFYEDKLQKWKMPIN